MDPATRQRLLELARVRPEARIDEAIPLSVAKPYRKAWDPTRYEKLFMAQPDRDKKGFRFYLPLVPEAVAAPSRIVDHLKDKGYEVEDYVAGIAKEIDGKRRMRIGRLLADDEYLAFKFANDPSRSAAKRGNLLVCISRHPYDIAGMSTDRGWTSCMRIGKSDEQGWNADKVGEYADYVLDDVKEGTLIAYLITADDKNVRNPIGRVLIKPYVNTEDPSDILLVRSEKTYGSPGKGLLKTVDAWLESVNGVRGDALYCISDKLYADGDDQEKPVGAFQQVRRQPTDFKTIRNPSEALTLYAVKLNHSNIVHVKDPKLRVKALSAQPLAIRFLRSPTEDEQIAAVSAHPNVIEHIDDPSESVVRTALRDSPYVIGRLKNPPLRWKVIAASEHPISIFYMKDAPKLAIRVAAKKDPLVLGVLQEITPDLLKEFGAALVARIKQEPHKIEHFRHKPLMLCIAAAESDYRTLRYCGGSNARPEVQMAAIRNNVRAINDIGWSNLTPEMRGYAEQELRKAVDSGAANPHLDYEIVQFAPEEVKRDFIARHPERAARYITDLTPEIADTLVRASIPAAIDVVAKTESLRPVIFGAMARVIPEAAPYLKARKITPMEQATARQLYPKLVASLQAAFAKLSPAEQKAVEVLDDLFHRGMETPFVTWARSAIPDSFPVIPRRWADRDFDEDD